MFVFICLWSRSHMQVWWWSRESSHFASAVGWSVSRRRPLFQLDISNSRIAELDAAAVLVRVQFARFNFRENRFRALEERFFDVVAGLGARLEEYQVVLLSEGARLERRDLARLLQVPLVAHQQYYDVRAGQGARVVQPIRERVERVTRGCVVHKQCTRSAPIVRARHLNEFKGKISFSTKWQQNELDLPERNLSWPAVSHICSFTTEPPTFTMRDPNSTPIVCELSSLTIAAKEDETSAY